MSTRQPKLNAAQSDYIPTPKERAALQTVADRLVAANPAPRLKMRDNQISIDHRDHFTGNMLLMKALGTTDSDFKNGMLEQLANANPPGSEESGLNFLLSVVKGIEPRDQIEAMLGAQMAVVHKTAMTFAQRIAVAENILEAESAERIVNKCARTFASQIQALKLYRSSGEQTVTVQNVSVRDQAQAIVGNVGQRAPDQTEFDACH